MLLLDEPLGALDLKLRKDMQTELKAIQKRLGITFIYVTHDQEEALSMSDTVVVMDKGKIQQIGTPEDIYNEPVNAFVADFIGESNIVDAIMIKDYLVSFGGVTFECLDSGFVDISYTVNVEEYYKSIGIDETPDYSMYQTVNANAVNYAVSIAASQDFYSAVNKAITAAGFSELVTNQRTPGDSDYDVFQVAGQNDQMMRIAYAGLGGVERIRLGVKVAAE